MSAWEAIKDAYTGALALLQAWWPFILIVAILCIIGGLLVSEWKHPAEDEPLSEQEKQALLTWMQKHPDLEEVSEESEEQS